MQVDGVAPRVAAEHGDGPAVGSQQAEQDADRDGLARPVRAEKPVHLTGVDLEIELVERPGGTERLDELLDSDRRRHRLSFRHTQCVRPAPPLDAWRSTYWSVGWVSSATRRAMSTDISTSTTRTRTTRAAESLIETPTGLKPVLDVVPEHCYERSTTRGLLLFAHDVAIFALAVWGLLSTDNPLLLVPLWLLAGISVAGLFVIGHDAAHEALFDSKRLNAVVARVSMLPSLHAVEVWVFGHNRVHHGHTLKQGLDFVWHPLTVEQYEELGSVAKLRHKLEWGPFGAGAYYLREVWWNKMVRFTPPARWARQMRRDQAIVALYALGTLRDARRARRRRRGLAMGEGRRDSVPAVLPDDRVGRARPSHRTEHPVVATP